MLEPEPSTADRAAESAARDSYGRLVALLMARSGDLAAVEDALADAFAAALRTWPSRGVPTHPEAWLLTAARRNLSRGHRHAEVRTRAAPALAAQHDPTPLASLALDTDRRLSLLFTCAHPAIDPAMHAPLMLQAVLGLDAERIGSAFLVAPGAVSQRLVRAKAKIRDARVPFEEPSRDQLPERLDAVLRAIYAAFGVGWDDLERGADLAEEALYIARVLRQLLPGEPEVKGLLALMLYCHARRHARRDATGRFVPLPDQEARRWHASAIREAEAHLREAAAMQRFGRFQCEAAIQSAHVQAAVTGVPRHDAVVLLYDVLLATEPTVGVIVARAAALVHAGRPGDADDALSGLHPQDVASYQPFHVVRGALLERRGQPEAARAHLERAHGLTTAPSVRLYLADWVARLSGARL